MLSRSTTSMCIKYPSIQLCNCLLAFSASICNHVRELSMTMLSRQSAATQKFDVFIRERGRWRFSCCVEADNEFLAKLKVLDENPAIPDSSISVYPCRQQTVSTRSIFKITAAVYLVLALCSFFFFNFFFSFILLVCALVLLSIN